MKVSHTRVTRMSPTKKAREKNNIKMNGQSKAEKCEKIKQTASDLCSTGAGVFGPGIIGKILSPIAGKLCGTVAGAICNKVVKEDTPKKPQKKMNEKVTQKISEKKMNRIFWPKMLQNGVNVYK